MNHPNYLLHEDEQLDFFIESITITNFTPKDEEGTTEIHLMILQTLKTNTGQLIARKRNKLL